ncbi:TolC family protein [Daejeonella lutea]|uniref:Outer membrane protein n=1 Tax=Daejeonella lutea TaxID=572036 RepID=A0A1T5A8M0_9SPHI|nr:TolC family protein [Daejeonella lutea]SKB31351.1 outer membrane protein [Daejeonella lutea]
MKRISFSFILFVISCLAYAQETIVTSLTLEQSISLALKHNIDVQRSMIQSENARIGLQQSRANLLPDLNGGVTHGINLGRSIDPFTNAFSNEQVTYAQPYLASSVTLFNGLALQNLIKQNSFLYQASKQEEQQAKDNLALNVTLAYLQVLTSKDLYDLALAQQEVTARQLERLDILNKNGSIAPAEFFDVKGQYSGDKLAVVNAGNALENAKIVLTSLLNIKYHKELSLDPLKVEEFGLSYERGAEQVYQLALNNYAGVKAADFRQRSALYNVRANRSRFFPSVFFDAGIRSNFSNAARDAQNLPVSYFRQYNNNISQGFSVGVNIPIFNAFRTKNNVSLAKLVQRESDLMAENVRVQLQQLTSQAFLNMEASRERYQNLLEQTESFAESFRTMEIRFNAGAINSVDYLVSKNNLDRANQNLATNRYDFILRKKVLDFYQGKTLQ